MQYYITHLTLNFDTENAFHTLHSYVWHLGYVELYRSSFSVLEYYCVSSRLILQVSTTTCASLGQNQSCRHHFKWVAHGATFKTSPFNIIFWCYFRISLIFQCKWTAIPLGHVLYILLTTKSMASIKWRNLNIFHIIRRKQNEMFTSFVNFKVCRDSSRVGDKIRARMPTEEWALRRSNIGIRNAAVLPLPVRAIATTSLPSSSNGIVWSNVQNLTYSGATLP